MPESIRCLRIVATAGALDALATDDPVLRIAPDEVLILTDAESVEVDDPHAIVEPDSGWSGVRTGIDATRRFLTRAASFDVPESDPGLAQGMAAGLPVVVWRNADRCVVMTPASLGHELAERFEVGE